MYKLLYDNPLEDVFSRLLKIRKIDDDIESFLNPTYSKYWIDPYNLNDMEKSITRIKKALKKGEKIMIFGDYDVDGITSSFLLYTFFTRFLGHKNISIRLPNRLKDGYGIKDYHLDEIISNDVKLVITVDNGITAIQEAKHAKKLGIDLIITDHHKALDEIPKAYSVINPQISENYPFKGIAGVGVAFKLASAITSQLIEDQSKKQEILNYLLPIVAIGTVADCVPLVHENRLFVKQGLDLINKRKGIPPSIINFIEYLKIKGDLDTYHIGYMLAPRLNAGGRMMTPYDSLYSLLYSDKSKQTEYLDRLEGYNDSRRKLQEDSFKMAESMISSDDKILIAASENFHEGVIGIVAGKLSEKYNKPSIVLSINKEENLAVGSLRGPEYFSVIDLLYELGGSLERYGGHAQAGGMTIKAESIDKIKELAHNYCQDKIHEKDLKKVITVDTPIYDHEILKLDIQKINNLGPFGEGNHEPNFLLENVIIGNAEKVGKTGNGHMKLHVKKGEHKFPVMFWGKGKEINNIEKNNEKKVIGKLRKDDYNGGFYIDGELMI